MKHLFFDLDNTVTRSRSPISPEMKAVLADSGKDVIIVSGATLEQIATQMDGLPCYKLGQNGNNAADPSGTVLWKEKLTEEEKNAIMAHIESLPRTWEVSDETDLVQDRKCQVSYSLLGHNEVLEKKEAFDPDGSLRKNLLAEKPFEADGLEVKVGGTTCLDYTRKGKNKGHYVARLIEERGWDKADCTYFGDMLFPGGNDESVLGVIATQAVTDPSDTLRQLKERSADITS